MPVVICRKVFLNGITAFRYKKNNAVKLLAALFLTICSTVLFLTVNFLVTVDGFVAKFFLDADKLVVFCHTVATGH